MGEGVEDEEVEGEAWWWRKEALVRMSCVYL